MATINLGNIGPISIIKNIARVVGNAGYSILKKEEAWFRLSAYKKADVYNDGNAMLSISADTSFRSSKISSVGRDFLKHVHKFQESGVPMIVTSNHSFKEVNSNSKTWHSPALVVSNGGAFAVDPFGEELVNKQIPEEAVKSINKVLEDLSAHGVVCLGTKDGVFAKPRGGLKLLDQQVYGKFDDEMFQAVMGSTNNICFNVINQREYASHSTTFHFPFLEYLFNTKKGAFDLTLKFTNPVLKLPLRRKKLSLFDTANQQEVMSNALKKLLEADKGIKDKYLDAVDVTITSNGLCFVPKGVSKQDTISKYCKIHGKKFGEVFTHGDSFDDFFRPVSLKELNKIYEYAKATGKPFDAIETIYSLAKCIHQHPRDFYNHEQTYMLGQNNTLSAKLLTRKIQEMEQEANKQQLNVLKDEQLRILQDDLNKQKQLDKVKLEEAYKKKLDEAKTEKAALQTELLAKKKLVDDDYAGMIACAPTADEKAKLAKERDLEQAKLDVEYGAKLKAVHELTADEKKALEKEFNDKKAKVDEEIDKEYSEKKAEIDKKETKDIPIKNQMMFECHNGGMAGLRGAFEAFSNFVLAPKKARAMAASAGPSVTP